MTASVPAKPTQRSFMDKLLDGVERVGNKVPHPVLMFAYLILLIIVAVVYSGLAGRQRHGRNRGARGGAGRRPTTTRT